jgi:hypothetical protein
MFVALVLAICQSVSGVYEYILAAIVVVTMFIVDICLTRVRNEGNLFTLYI